MPNRPALKTIAQMAAEHLNQEGIAMRKRILSAVLALCLTVTLLPVNARAAEPATSGTYLGMDWTFDKGSGTLAFDYSSGGNGVLGFSSTSTTVDSYYNAPYYPFSLDVNTVTIGGSVTCIGQDAFYLYPSLHTVAFPSTLTDICKDAFYNTAVTRVEIPNTVTFIGENAFPGVAAAYIPSGVRTIRNSAFNYARVIYYGGTETQWKNNFKSACSSSTQIICDWSGPGIPSTTVASAEQLQELVNNNDGNRYIRVLLDGDLDFGSGTLTIPKGRTLDLDLNGHSITAFGSSPVVTVNGELLLEDSKAVNVPVVHDDDTVTYASGRVYTSNPDPVAKQTAVLVQNGGFFEICSGTVESTDGTAIFSRARSTDTDAGSSVVFIYGGYVKAKESAVMVLGDSNYNASLYLKGAVLLSENGAAVSGSELPEHAGTKIEFHSGTLISKSDSASGRIPCGIYHPQKGNISVNYGKIRARGGIGILMRGGFLKVVGGHPGRKPNAIVGDEQDDAGTVGGFDQELPSGKAVVLDQKSGGYDGAAVGALVDNNCPTDFEPTVLYDGDCYELVEVEDTWETIATRYYLHKIGYTITFDANGGAVTPDSDSTDAGGKLTELPTPTRVGYRFDGWYTAASGGDKVTKEHEYAGNTTIYAHWEVCTNHIWVLKEETEEKATCTTDGSKSYVKYCKLCGKEETGKETLPATGHKLSDTEISSVIKEPTCKEPGIREYRTACTVEGCGYEVTRTEEISETDSHTWGEWKVTKEPTETETGLEERTCGVCGTTEKREIAVGHEHKMGEEKPSGAKAATCTVDGFEKYTAQCTVDGCTYKEEREKTIPATGHKYGEWVTTKAATATQDGSKERECSVCKVKQQETIPATGGSGAASKTYVITFNANGGAGGTSLTTGTDGRLSTLPGTAPTRTGYTFDGWYTASSGGSKVTTSTVFSANTTVYAHWSQTSGTSSIAYYQIYTPGSTYGGSFSVSHSSAAAGDVVTVTISPWNYYGLNRLSATRMDTGWDLYLSGRDSRYTFVMPASDVRLNITYTAIYAGGTNYSYTEPASAKPAKWYFRDGCIYHVTDGLVPLANPFTRDMLISILYNMDYSSFGDPTIWAVTNDVVPDIYASWLWGRDKSISREQTVMILFCYAKHMGYNTSPRASLAGYTDSGQIRSAAWPAMSWSRAVGLMTGTSNTTLSPQSVVDCGQANVILSRFLSNVAGTR